MITIRPFYNCWTVLLSNPGTGQRGISVKAYSFDEVHAAIDHTQGRPHDTEDCPFCRSANRVTANLPAVS